MKQQTRKNSYKNKNKNNGKEKSLASNKNAKKGTLLKCKLKSCRAIKYQSVYGSVTGRSARAPIQFFY